MNLVSPWFLAAFAALALPWLLHRFSDARPERRPFPSIRFLEPTSPPVSRRRLLRHRALFALRVLAIAALALLFAEPWIARPDALLDSRGRHVIAIDTSMSMRTGQRFERALAAANDVLDAIPAGDTVRIAGVDADVTLLGDEEGTVADARATLARAARARDRDDADGALLPGHAAADYGRLMQRLDRLADEGELPLGATLITDVQRTSLPERRNALFAPRLASLEIVDVSDGESNVALTAEAASSDGAQARVVVSLIASGAASGAAVDVTAGTASGIAADSEPPTREVTLSSGGQTLARETVRLTPGGREQIVFDAVTLPDRVDPRFTVALDAGDGLAEDDVVEIPVRLAGKRRVALAALGERADDAARVFVTTALEADGAATVDSSTLATGQLPEDARRLVVFAALGDGESLPAELSRHVARGGAALVIDAGPRDASLGESDGEPGGEVVGETAAAFGRSSGGPSGGPSGSEAGGPLGSGTRGVPIGLVDESHPLAPGDIDWSDVRYFAAGGFVPGETDRVLIETADRRPVLVERASESGLLLILNERLDGGDSNLPFTPAFVALMRNAVDWFDADRAVPERVTVGEPLVLPFNVQVIRPDGRPFTALAESGDTAPVTFDTPGLYTVAGALGEQTLLVVTDPLESDLGTLDTAAIAAWRGRHAADAPDVADASGGDDGVAEAAVDERSGAVSDARERGLALWPFLLPLLAALLLAETLYANRRLDVRRDGT